MKVGVQGVVWKTISKELEKLSRRHGVTSRAHLICIKPICRDVFLDRNEIRPCTTGDSPKFGLNVCDRVVIARPIVMSKEGVYVPSSPTFTEPRVRDGKAIEDRRFDCQTKNVGCDPIHRPPMRKFSHICL